MSLEELRAELDRVDAELLEVLARRAAVVQRVVAEKEQGAEFLRDRSREEALLGDRIERGRAHGLDRYFVTRVFQEVIEHSLRLQRDHLVRAQNPQVADRVIAVGYHGSAGSYSHEAAQRHFAGPDEQAVFHGFRTFRELVESVVDGGCDFGVLPIENTTAGTINETYDLLAQYPVAAVGEEALPIEHCLVGVEDVPLGHLRRVYSHPMAIAQCSDFLATLPDARVESYPNTAMAVELIRHANDPTQAAIASEQAARLHGLRILKRAIANRRENQTRFLVIARDAVRYDPRIDCKTSLIVATRHEEGALVRALNTLAAHHLNLTKLESRPRPNVPWEYLFYMDFEGNVADPRVREALDELAKDVSFFKVLGSYPARTTAAARPATPPGLAARSGTGGRAASPDVAAGPPSREREAGPSERLEVAIRKGYKLASRAHHPADSQVRVGSVLLGGGAPFVVMAGPCSVESAEQVDACARAAREHGAAILRGGVFKPRTSTYAFQGLGWAGLDLLLRAGRGYGLPVVTEVLHTADVRRLAKECDMLQVGARNMQNFALLRELGQVDRPVLLKRGPMSSIDELLAASEYLLAAGNQQVILCERGIRTFETATRYTLDIAAVPVLRERTHLPIVVDPSHAAGDWRWVAPLSEAAVAAGAHGVIVEIHPEPERALSDGPQALTLERFATLMERIGRLTAALAA